MRTIVIACAGLLVLASCESGGDAEAPWNTALTPETHARFPISRGEIHWGYECNACHTGDTFLKFDCLSCHPHDDRATTTANHDGLADFSYDSAACFSCHPDGRKEGAPANHDTKDFPISGGTKHAGVSCGQCHPSPADRTQITCSGGGCHADAEVTPAHADVGGFGTDTALCLRCHADAQVDRVSAHLPMAIAQGKPHHLTQCQGCHPRLRTDKPFAADYAQRECISCHSHEKAAMDTAHAVVPGYAYTDRDCMTCHPDGTKGSTVAHPYFPLDAGSHQSVDCTQCHQNATERKDVTCSSGTCHPAAAATTQHVAVGGYDAATCKRCHADDQVDRVAAHTPMGIQDGTPHFQQDCLKCHPSMRTEPAKAFAADFRKQDCLGCHEHEKTLMDGAHAAIPGYAYTSRDCTTCHPDGTRNAVFDHPYFPIAAGSHELDCASCHANQGDRTDVTCTSTSCHPAAAVTPQHVDVGGFAVDSKLCKRCHPDDTPVFRLAAHVAPGIPFGIASGTAHFQEKCLTCHPALRTDANKTFGANFAVQTCTDASCHPQATTTTQHAGTTGFKFATASCKQCHPTGSAKDAVDHTDKYPIGAGTSHDVACDECHRDAANTRNVTCAGSCHTTTAMGTAHTGKVGGYQYQNALCLKCHPDTPAFRLTSHKPFVITATGRHSKCLTCHIDVLADRPFPAANFELYTCTQSSCHERGETDGHHVGRAGYAYVSTTCTKAGCHPDGRSR